MGEWWEGFAVGMMTALLPSTAYLAFALRRLHGGPGLREDAEVPSQEATPCHYCRHNTFTVGGLCATCGEWK